MLQEFYTGFKNYQGVEDSDEGVTILNDLVNNKFVLEFTSMKDLVKYLGMAPVVAKLALITTANDGVTKHRLILDCRVSGANDHARKSERILLPPMLACG